MIKFLLQNNLGKTEDIKEIADICNKYQISYELIDVIPFSSDLPNISKQDCVVPYGATHFIDNLYNANICEGIFYNSNFSYKEYIRYYGKYMLNYPCTFTTFEEIHKIILNDKFSIFVRPVSDKKEFAGTVMRFQDLLEWEMSLRRLEGIGNNFDVNLKTEIVISEPYNITKEWRLFILNGKYLTGSLYRENFKLKLDSFVPNDVIEFAELMCNLWMPNSTIFSMDIGENSGNLYIIECGCFNSSGFYACDKDKLFYELHNYLKGLIK